MLPNPTYYLRHGVIFSTCISDYYSNKPEENLAIAETDSVSLQQWTQIRGHKFFTFSTNDITKDDFLNKASLVRTYMQQHGHKYTFFAFIASTHGTMVNNMSAILFSTKSPQSPQSPVSPSESPLLSHTTSSPTDYMTHQDIRDYFSNRDIAMPSFKGKPKIYVFDCCMGGQTVLPLSPNIKGPSHISYHPDGDQIIFKANTNRHTASWCYTGSYLVNAIVAYLGGVHCTDLKDIYLAMGTFINIRSRGKQILEPTILCSYPIRVIKTTPKSPTKEVASNDIPCPYYASNDGYNALNATASTLNYEYHEAKQADLHLYIKAVNSSDPTQICHGLRYVINLLDKMDEAMYGEDEINKTEFKKVYKSINEGIIGIFAAILKFKNNEEITYLISCILSSVTKQYRILNNVDLVIQLLSYIWTHSKQFTNHSEILPLIIASYAAICNKSKQCRLQLIECGVYGQILNQLEISIRSEEDDLFAAASYFVRNILQFDEKKTENNIEYDLLIWNEIYRTIPIVQNLLIKSIQPLSQNVGDDVQEKCVIKYINGMRILKRMIKHQECYGMIEDIFNYGIIDSIYSFIQSDYDDDEYNVSKDAGRVLIELLSGKDSTYITTKMILHHNYLEFASTMLESDRQWIHKYIIKSIRYIAQNKEFCQRLIQFGGYRLIDLLVKSCFNVNDGVQCASIQSICKIIQQYNDRYIINHIIQQNMLEAITSVIEQFIASNDINKKYIKYCMEILDVILSHSSDHDDDVDYVQKCLDLECNDLLNDIANGTGDVAKYASNLMDKYFKTDDSDGIYIQHDSEDDTDANSEILEDQNKCTKQKVSDKPSNVIVFNGIRTSNYLFANDNCNAIIESDPTRSTITVSSSKPLNSSGNGYSDNIIADNPLFNVNSSHEFSSALHQLAEDNKSNVISVEPQSNNFTIPPLEMPTTNKRYQCKKCAYSTNIKTNFNKHMRVHNGIKEKRKNCGICARSFSCSAYYEHRKRCGKITIKSFKCSFCNKGFERKKGLIEHERIHSGEKPYKCRIIGCHKAYPSYTGYVQHQRNKHKKEWMAFVKSKTKQYKR